MRSDTGVEFAAGKHLHYGRTMSMLIVVLFYIWRIALHTQLSLETFFSDTQHSSEQLQELLLKLGRRFWK